MPRCATACTPPARLSAIVPGPASLPRPQALQVDPAQPLGQLVRDTVLAPPLAVEVRHGGDDPVTGPPALLSVADSFNCDDGSSATSACSYGFAAEHRFRHRKGPDLAHRWGELSWQGWCADMVCVSAHVGGRLHMDRVGLMCMPACV